MMILLPRIRWIEKGGGGAVQGKEMRDVVRLAVERWRAWSAVVDEAVVVETV